MHKYDVGCVTHVYDPQPVRQSLANYKVLDEPGLDLASDFIMQCLHLDPTARPDASMLRQHNWLKEDEKA